MYQRVTNDYNQHEYGPNYPSEQYYNPLKYGLNYPPQQPYYPYDQQQQIPYHSPYPNEPVPPPTPFAQFAKPAQPQNWPAFMQQNPNFFPQQQEAQQPSNNLIAYFQDQNGQVDFGKMLSTVSQVANTFQQVTPVIQQISSMIKSFR